MGPSHGILPLLIVAATVSSFTFVAIAEETTNGTSSPTQKYSKTDKGSQEEIMFGNQQNTPNGLVDDLMGLPDKILAEIDEENNTSTLEKKSDMLQDMADIETVPEVEELKSIPSEGEEDVVAMGSGPENWYNDMPVIPGNLQYLTNGAVPKTHPAPEDYSNGLYDQEELYRRKRQILERPLPLRKRSLRSSLGQMMQKRGIRMPRRSMRLKRQVDMQELLKAFGGARYENEDRTVPHIFSGRAQTFASKRRVPSRYEAYPEVPVFRYPSYVFRHRDGGVLSTNNDVADETPVTNDDVDTMEDMDSYMLMPPNTPSNFQNLLPYRTREDENDVVQKWLSRHTTPSVFRVSRRSSPFFYPIDYRYMSGMKKRSRFDGPSIDRVSSGPDDSDSGSEFGKWGHVVQVPEAYASPEDIVRIYGLANLLAEDGDEVDPRLRRTA